MSSDFLEIKARQALEVERVSPTECQRPLLALLDLINSNSNQTATSSCSGRVVVYAQVDDDAEPVEGEETVELALSEHDDGIHRSKLNPDAPPDSQASDTAQDDNGKGRGRARSMTINGKSGGIYIYKSHSQVSVPREEHQVIGMLFSGVDVLPWEDNAPLSNAETTEDIRLVKGGIVTLSFEAMVLNITSASLADAVPLLQAALRCGHRSSGLVLPALAVISPGHSLPLAMPGPGSPLEAYLYLPTTLAIRSSSMSMSIPIARKVIVQPSRSAMSSHLKDPTRSAPPVPSLAYQLLVPPSYLSFLLRQANLRMASNTIRVERLYHEFDRLLGGGQADGRENRRTDRVEGEKVRVEDERVRVEACEIAKEKEEALDKRMKDGVGGVDEWLKLVASSEKGVSPLA